MEKEFVNALNELLLQKEEILAEWSDKFDRIYSTDKLKTKVEKIQTRMDKIAEKAEKLIEENPSNFNEAYTALLQEYEELERGACQTECQDQRHGV